MQPFQVTLDEIDQQVQKMHVTSEKAMWDNLKQV